MSQVTRPARRFERIDGLEDRGRGGHHATAAHRHGGGDDDHRRARRRSHRAAQPARSTTRSPSARWRGWSTSRSLTAASSWRTSRASRRPGAVLAIAEQAQVEPAWSKPLARAAVDAVVSTGGFTPLDHLDDLVEGLVEGSDGDTPADVASRGAQLAKILALVILPLQGTPGIAPSDFDPSGDSATPVDIRPTVLASAGDGTFSAMTFNGRLYVLLVGGTQPSVLIDHVKAAQQPNGAWNFGGTPSGHSVDADTTGLALQALVVAPSRRTIPPSGRPGRPGREPATRRELAVVRRGGSQLDRARGAGHPATGGDPNTPCWREALDDAWAGVHYADPADWLRGEQADGRPHRGPGRRVRRHHLRDQPGGAGDPRAQPAVRRRLARTSVRGRRRRRAVRPLGLRRSARPPRRRRRRRSRPGVLARGRSPTSVIRTMASSAEYRRAVVDGFYGDYFGRDADPSGVATWSPWVTVLRVRVEASLLASGEYFGKAGVHGRGLRRRAYRDILGRSRTAGPRRPSSPSSPSAGAARPSPQAVLASGEARGHLVDQLYEGLLRRSPDASGRGCWRPAGRGDLGRGDHRVAGRLLRVRHAAAS